MDNSFLKLHTSIDEALSVGRYKTTQISYYSNIQLSPNETYLQITNVENGIAFNSNYEVNVIDSCGNSLKDITDNVFIEQFSDSNGLQQCVIEIVNIGEDFYGRSVILRFKNTVSEDYYYTYPLKITDKDIEKTIRFDYRNYETIDNIDYTNAPYTQSIRLKCEYVKPKDNSEVEEYYQISRGSTISARYLEKTSHEYLLDSIDIFTYDRLKKMFKQSVIYLDNVRVTNKPLLVEGERKGRTNILSANFDCYLDNEDIFTFSYQIFEGLNVASYTPKGIYSQSTVFLFYTIAFNYAPILNTGTIKVYNSSNVLLHTFTESDMFVSFNSVLADATGTPVQTLVNGDYYVHVSSGLASLLGETYEGVNDNVTWIFTVQDGDYSDLDYSTDYLTN